MCLKLNIFERRKAISKWTNVEKRRDIPPKVKADIPSNALELLSDQWYLYSSDFDPDCGPMVTTFNFEPHESYQLVGGIRPQNPIEKYDEIF